jgi:hypothetical protein
MAVAADMQRCGLRRLDLILSGLGTRPPGSEADLMKLMQPGKLVAMERTV